MTISSNYSTESKKSQYTPTIGVECHVQLATKTKLFSPANNDARGQAPNTCLSPIDYALPGMLPILNQSAVQLAIQAGRAMNCKINAFSRFDRKHYFYPDSPKGYQITQFFAPIIGAGFVELPNGKKIRIEHAHLEGDAGKLTHFSNYSLIDFNRVDTPLIEIVSMPDLHSATDTRDYCKELWRLMTFAQVSHGDLYNGNMRFDINISLAPTNTKKLGTRVEIKNLNSFRSIEHAVIHEIARQTKLLNTGKKVIQETRGWSDATGKTTSQRSKEEAKDYRYMPEPDLPPLNLSADFIATESKKLPLMPADYRRLFSRIIPTDTLEILLDHPKLMRGLADLTAIKTTGGAAGGTPKASSSERLGETVATKPAEIINNVEMAQTTVSETVPRNSHEDFVVSEPRDGGRERTWSQELSSSIMLIANLFTSVLLAEENTSLLNDELPSTKQLLDLTKMNFKKELSSTATKEVFLKFFDPKMHYKDTNTIAKELGLIQENDLGVLEQIVDKVLSKPETKKAQEDYKNGEEKVLGFLIGQIMKESKGKANPTIVQQILKTKLKN